ncbi:MAG: squalene/phytoene synthase family protein, partial [Phycisphaerales bacterium]|nr:squalene/phytoene synthase family protein [Phycisphaerales bacterium]
EIGDPKRSSQLLQWWGEQLLACFDGQPTHPVFIALAPVIQRHGLSIDPFTALLDAFRQDQTASRYERWDDLLAYCRGSANPVGRLVLAIADEPCTPSQMEASDSICTALQLANHWQDVQRDLLDRDRIYIPAELHDIADFDKRLLSTASQGYAPDPQFLKEYRTLLQDCIDRTWSLFESGESLIDSVNEEIRPVVWLFAAGGTTILRRMSQWNFETCLGRPRVGTLTKLRLLLGARRAVRARGMVAT